MPSPFSYNNLRRPTVNVIGSGGSSSYDEDTERKSCPRCSILLIFREDLNSLFCKKCAYRPPPLPELPRSKTPQEEGEEEDAMSTIDGLQTKLGQRGTSVDESEYASDHGLRIRPIAHSGRRSVDQLQRDANKRRGLDVMDKDLQMLLDKPGISITDSSVEVSSDGTYNSADMINSSSSSSSRRKGRLF